MEVVLIACFLAVAYCIWRLFRVANVLVGTLTEVTVSLSKRIDALEAKARIEQLEADQ